MRFTDATSDSLAHELHSLRWRHLTSTTDRQRCHRASYDRLAGSQPCRPDGKGSRNTSVKNFTILVEPVKGGPGELDYLGRGL